MKWRSNKLWVFLTASRGLRLWVGGRLFQYQWTVRWKRPVFHHSNTLPQSSPAHFYVQHFYVHLYTALTFWSFYPHVHGQRSVYTMCVEAHVITLFLGKVLFVWGWEKSLFCCCHWVVVSSYAPVPFRCAKVFTSAGNLKKHFIQVSEKGSKMQNMFTSC